MGVMGHMGIDEVETKPIENTRFTLTKREAIWFDIKDPSEKDLDPFL
jgi:hypothetical protein